MPCMKLEGGANGQFQNTSLVSSALKMERFKKTMDRDTYKYKGRLPSRYLVKR